MSRAERQKQDRAEQERIRKEFEKDKAAAKARLAREKKRDKELAEREQKKKLRMPLVNVRPSQDTIARFVRGNGSGRKRDVEGDALERRDGVEVETCEGTGDGDAGARNGGRELDLIPEEDESDLEKLLDTITNETSGLAPHKEARVEPDTLPEKQEPEHHQPKPQEPVHQEQAQQQSKQQESKQPEPKQPEPKQQEPIQPPPHKDPNSQPQNPQTNTGDMKPPARPYQRTHQPSKPTSSPPPIIHPPPMSTQAILGSLDDFFPSSSQQALELQDETFDDMLNDSYDDIMHTPTRAKNPDQVHEKSMPPPKRFFTSSGSKELISLAIQRSKRTAALEELQDEQVQLQKCRGIQTSKQHSTAWALDDIDGVDINQMLEDKENVLVKTGPLCDISDSQETEYGGDWVDELALDLIV